MEWGERNCTKQQINMNWFLWLKVPNIICATLKWGRFKTRTTIQNPFRPVASTCVKNKIGYKIKSEPRAQLVEILPFSLKCWAPYWNIVYRTQATSYIFYIQKNKTSRYIVWPLKPVEITQLSVGDQDVLCTFPKWHCNQHQHHWPTEHASFFFKEWLWARNTS